MSVEAYNLVAAQQGFAVTLHLAPNVPVLPVITSLDIDVERIMRAAEAANLQRAIVIGWDAEGVLRFFSSTSDGGDVLWMMEMAKKRLLVESED